MCLERAHCRCRAAPTTATATTTRDDSRAFHSWLAPQRPGGSRRRKAHANVVTLEQVRAQRLESLERHNPSLNYSHVCVRRCRGYPLCCAWAVAARSHHCRPDHPCNHCAPAPLCSIWYQHPPKAERHLSNVSRAAAAGRVAYSARVAGAGALGSSDAASGAGGGAKAAGVAGAGAGAGAGAQAGAGAGASAADAGDGRLGAGSGDSSETADAGAGGGTTKGAAAAAADATRAALARLRHPPARLPVPSHVLQDTDLRARVQAMEKEVVGWRERDWKWQVGHGIRELAAGKATGSGAVTAPAKGSQAEAEAAREKEAKATVDKMEVLAWLRGSQAVYAMRTRQVLLGRHAPVRTHHEGLSVRPPCGHALTWVIVFSTRCAVLLRFATLFPVTANRTSLWTLI